MVDAESEDLHNKLREVIREMNKVRNYLAVGDRIEMAFPPHIRGGQIQFFRGVLYAIDSHGFVVLFDSAEKPQRFDWDNPDYIRIVRIV